MNSRGAQSRRGKKPREDDKKDASRKRAQALVEQGMPFQMAMAVANGRMTLNDALQRMATQSDVEKLITKHDLSRALATQIAIGHAKLEDVLRRRRLQAHRDEHGGRSCLDGFLASGEEVVLAVHGGAKKKGKVLENGSYNIVFDEGSGGEELHKLQIKLAYRSGDWKRVRKALKTDKERATSPKEPIPRPQDRYSVSNKRLFRYVDNAEEITVTTLEGEVLRGTLSWFSRFELELSVKGGIPVWVFRHAVDDIST